MYAAFGRGDVPAILAHLAEDVSWEVEAPAVLAWAGVKKGPSEVSGFFEGIQSQWKDHHLNMTNFLEDGDRVAVFGRFASTNRETGIRVDSPIAHFFQFQEGKVVRVMNISNSAAFVDATRATAEVGMTNTELVQEMYAAFGRGDIAAIVAHMADDVSWEFEAPASLPWSGLLKGPAEAVRFFQGLDAELADHHLEMTDFFEKGDKVAAFGRYAATNRATGIRVETPVGHLFEFRAGKVARYVNIVNSGAFVEAQTGASAASA
jgi:ketosteroid isomerase-like protein